MAQKTELLNTYQIPTYAICPLENGDFSGNLTEEDIHNIKVFEEKISNMCPNGYILNWDEEGFDSPSFTFYPEFGLAMDCVELTVYKINDDESNQDTKSGEEKI